MNFGIVGFPRKAFPVSKPDGTQGEMTLNLLRDADGEVVLDGEATMTIKVADGEEWLITEAMFEQALAGMRAARFWQLGRRALVDAATS